MTDQTETFEAEGQSKIKMMEEDIYPPLTGEEDHVKEVWQKLGMDITKDITMSDLGRVCQHIGMEMGTEELTQIFGRLDGDGDGRITYDEFHQGLFEHGLSANQPMSADNSLHVLHVPHSLPHTPQPRRRSRDPNTPVRSQFSQPRHQSRGLTPVRSHDDSMRALTPSGNPAATGSGIFSVLDNRNTGFCSMDDLLENWESVGVWDGEDILTTLGFSSQSQISLPELSFLLTQEITGAADQNSMFQAAFLSYQQELQHTRLLLEQTNAEKNKFRQDLTSANSRNEMLVKEADERQTRLEQSMEAKIVNLELKYQEQIKVLQGSLEEDRENQVNQSARMKQKLEDKIEGLKHEEARVKENLIRSQKENEKLEGDVNDLMDQLDENEMINNQLKRDLQAANDLHQSFLDGHYPDDTQGFYQIKAQQLQSENKILTDKVDELTAEVERLKLDLLTVRRTSVHGGQNVTSSPGNKRRRQHSTEYLTSEESVDEAPVAMSPDEQAQSEAKLLELVYELEIMKKSSEEERKDIEQIFKMEIVEIEERHDLEKEQLLRSFTKEKEKFREDLESTHQDALAELNRQLQNEFAEAKQDLIVKYESEKNYMDHKFSEEKSLLEQRLENSPKADSSLNLSRTDKDSSFEKNQVKEDFTKERANLLDRFLKEKRDLEELHAQEKAEIFKDVEAERKELVQQYKGEITELKHQITSLRERLEMANEQLSENQIKLKEAYNKLNLQEAELTRKIRGKLTQEITEKLSKELKEKLTQEIIEETEEVFVAQIQEIRKAHEADRKTLEDSRKLLQDELETIRHHRKTQTDEITELKKINHQLQSERDDLNAQLKTLGAELRTLKESHNTKLAELAVEKQEALVVQSKAESMESSNRTEKDLYVENKDFESTVQQLQKDNIKLQNENTNLKMMEDKHNEIVKDKKVLEGRVQSAELSMQKLMDSQETLLKAQSDKDDLLKRNAGLEEELLKKDKFLSTIQQSMEKLQAEEELRVTQGKLKTLREVPEKSKSESDVASAPLGMATEASVKQLIELELLLKEARGRAHKSEEDFKHLEQQTALILLNSERLHQHQLEKFEIRNKEILTKLDHTRNRLNENTEKYKQQCLESIRSNIEMKELDKKNGQLHKALFLTEARQKRAEANCYDKEERCQAYMDMACRVTRAAIPPYR